MITAQMKKYRGLLRATVLEESRGRRTSQEIAKISQRRHGRAINPVIPTLVTAKIVKDIDDVRHVGRNSAVPQQGELFDEYKFATIISVPVKEEGKKIRIERRALGSLSFDELTQWIIERQARAPRRNAPLDGYITLRDDLAPYVSSGNTTLEMAYRAMKKAQKSA